MGKKRKRRRTPGEDLDNVPGLFVEAEFDETNEKDTKRIREDVKRIRGDVKRVREFLKEYRALCRKYGCLVVSDGEEVEVVPSVVLANEDDPWGVGQSTRERGWKI